jgi:hypothetical protein
MDNQLSITSLVVLLFFLCWFAWDQNKLIRSQQEKILLLEQKMIFQSLVIEAALQNNNYSPIPTDPNLNPFN